MLTVSKINLKTVLLYFTARAFYFLFLLNHMGSRTRHIYQIETNGSTGYPVTNSGRLITGIKTKLSVR